MSIVVSLALLQVANMNSAGNLESHEELKNTLAAFQDPLNRWSEQLTKITDDLDGGLRPPAPSRSTDQSQRRGEPRSCAGYLPSHTSNTTNRRRKACSREPGNGFSRTPSLQSGRERVPRLYSGFTAFRGLVRANLCKYPCSPHSDRKPKRSQVCCR